MERNVFDLQSILSRGEYKHGDYYSFYICDPKRRHIHKPIVTDRLLHHGIFRVLEPILDKSFIFDSYSSRKDKGIHKAIKRFEDFAWHLSKNNTKTVWALKCDIRKFFASVDQDILLKILERKINCPETIELLSIVIRSFPQGIPLGNLTSQLFSNVYMDVFDQFVKRRLGIKYYVRYADDFLILDQCRENLENLIPVLRDFLATNLKLELHPNKILLRKWHSGVDFLGYNSFPHHRVLRTKTKKRMFFKVAAKNIASYLGVLSHANSYKLKENLLNNLENDII